MYKKIITVILLSSLAACGGKKVPSDKKQQLEQLKKEDATLKVKIAELEKEVQASTGDSSEQKVEIVTIGKPLVKTFQHFLEVQGKVDSDENSGISAKAPGVITDVRVQRGDRVVRGQVLIQLDDAVMRQGMAELKNTWELANTVYLKQKKLWDQKIGTEIQYLTAKNNKESLDRKERTMEEQIDMYRIKSPINGTVDEVVPKIGETVAPGLPLVRVINLDKSKVVAEVSESYASKIHAGDEVMVRFPDENKEIKSKIRVVSQAINPTNRTFTVELALNSKEVVLHPNMIVIVRINDYKKDKAVVIPVNIVQKDEKTTFVYVAVPKGNKYAAGKKVIQTGSAYGDEVEILSGLNAEDNVITGGYQNVTDGQDIEVKK
jgi:RND family efflux transporter MFP subunit